MDSSVLLGNLQMREAKLNMEQVEDWLAATRRWVEDVEYAQQEVGARDAFNPKQPANRT